jgi:hypothetical protein
MKQKEAFDDEQQQYKMGHYSLSAADVKQE